MKIFLFILFVYFLSVQADVFSQKLALGQWRDHLPYNQTTSVEESTDKIFCATPHSVFSYSKTDQSIERISKANGLSDVGVSAIKFHSPSGNLIIAYNNGNIDLYNKSSTTNISDIKRSPITAGKNINKIILYGNYAYLACGYGISVLDVSKKEIKETYFLGNSGTYINVNDIAFDEQKIFAATDSGVYSAPLNSSNLADFSSWTKHGFLPDGKYSQAEFFNGKIYVNFNGPTYESDSIYVFENNSWSRISAIYQADVLSMNAAGEKITVTKNWSVSIFDKNWEQIEIITTYQTPRYIEPRDAITGNNNIIWIADNAQGLIKRNNPQSHEVIIPNGPFGINSYQMNFNNGKLCVASGRRDRSSGGNVWLDRGIYSFSDENWTNYNYETTPGMLGYDFISAAIDPSNSNRIYAGSFGWGVLEILNGKINKTYNESNSSLQAAPPPNQTHIGITGLAFDSQNNLWVVNSNTTKPISKKTPDGKWQSFTISELYLKQYIGNILTTKSGQKWIELPGEGIVVLAGNNSILLTSGNGKGGLNNLDIRCMAEDRDGKIWVGNTAGIEVFNAPLNVFSGGNFDAQRILVTQNGYTGYLLETETVIAIAVDGANRKWVGTNGAGVFLLSSDGTQQLQHFTQENSPLLSNFITCIAINDKTGEVFFGTENGICSYKSDATAGAEEFNDVYAYPNPVQSGYEGPIAIKNLITDAAIKITDLSGSLVFETTALGGQAIWHGKDVNGTRVKTGVYLVFCSDKDGILSAVTKILFIN